MKHNFILTILFLTTVAGCKKNYFDAVPKDLVSTNAIFKNKVETENWLASVYSTLVDPWSTTTGSARYWAGFTEELEPASATLQASGILSGVNAVNSWTSHYQGIRMANIFIQNIDNSKSNLLKEPNGEELMIQYKAEARFLRAYFYWNLMKLYGPVILVGDEPGRYNDNYQLSRNSWKECIDYILSEMDSAYAVLPGKYLAAGGTEDATQTGRITKRVIEAVKSQVLLFDASPLYNGNPDFANYRNEDGKQLMNTSYDPGKWAIAAAAIKTAIDSSMANGKKIFKQSNADPFVAAFMSYRDLFLTGWSTEGIWTRAVTAYQTWENDAAPRAVNGTGFNASLVVPQEMVDKYRMIEMAYEGCRFFDLRRWKIANTPEGRQGGDFTGMNVFEGTGLSDPAFYVKTRTSSRVWDNKFYIFPIPQSELNKNFAMVQAPGY